MYRERECVHVYMYMGICVLLPLTCGSLLHWVARLPRLPAGGPRPRTPCAGFAKPANPSSFSPTPMLALAVPPPRPSARLTAARKVKRGNVSTWYSASRTSSSLTPSRSFSPARLASAAHGATRSVFGAGSTTLLLRSHGARPPAMPRWTWASCSRSVLRRIKGRLGPMSASASARRSQRCAPPSTGPSSGSPHAPTQFACVGTAFPFFRRPSRPPGR